MLVCVQHELFIQRSRTAAGETKAVSEKMVVYRNRLSFKHVKLQLNLSSPHLHIWFHFNMWPKNNKTRTKLSLVLWTPSLLWHLQFAAIICHRAREFLQIVAGSNKK